MSQSISFITPVFFVLIVAPAQLAAEGAHVPIEQDSLVGEWCGEIAEFGYSWRHRVRADGTYSTTFRSFETPSSEYPDYTEHGKWSLTDDRVTEFALRKDYVDGTEEFVFPPEIYEYQVAKLTAGARHLYYSNWDATFESTRCEGYLGS